MSDRLSGMTEYYKMPPIYELEDYDRCMEEFPNNKNIYCYARTQIKPNEKSELWLYIQITYDPNSIQNALASKVKYDKEINICVNYKLKKQYGLMAYSEVEYCLTNSDSRVPDALDIVLAIIFFTLILIIASSTYFDFRLKLQNFGCNRNSEHYKTPVHGPYASVVVSFSIPRNWYRLTTKVHSQTSDDLRPVQALRFLTMFGVVIGHCVLFMNVMPLYNPEYMEKNFYRVVTMFLVNGTTIIQTFFAISGYLLSVQFVKLQEISTFSFKYFWTSILYRYLRLTPVYLFIILFHSTWLVWLQSGPLWPHIAETERTYCRNNWWANLLYLNNIFTLAEPCLQHGWYLAADFQMFVVGVVMQLLFWKYPRCKKWVLSAAILISAVIPGVITYVNRYDGAFMIRPEQPTYASDMTIAVQVFSVFALSYGAALLLCLGIELPSSALQRHFAGRKMNNDNGGMLPDY
ncbi:hypothetical protein HA402_014620 [Bradysia odoriphaga]|nr:hypothetical protein HA402_014620 [Bradysia odoriphaga]